MERKTRQVLQDHTNVRETEDKRLYVPMGSVFMNNDSSAEGIIYEDVDVTNGDMPGSVVTKGVVYVDRLSEELTDGARNALEALGFIFVEETQPVTRPF